MGFLYRGNFLTTSFGNHVVPPFTGVTTGAGTNWPFSFSFAEMMNIWWKAGTFQVTGIATITGPGLTVYPFGENQSDSTPATAYRNLGIGTSTSPPVPQKTSDVLTFGLPFFLANGPPTNTRRVSASVSFLPGGDGTFISDRVIKSNSDWEAATYFPFAFAQGLGSITLRSIITDPTDVVCGSWTFAGKTTDLYCSVNSMGVPATTGAEIEFTQTSTLVNE